MVDRWRTASLVLGTLYINMITEQLPGSRR